MGGGGPWREAIRSSLNDWTREFLGPDGLNRCLVGLDGRPRDATPHVYDQAFALLGLASLSQAAESGAEALALAQRMREGLEALRHPAGGFRESGDPVPYTHLTLPTHFHLSMSQIPVPFTNTHT